MRSYLKSKATEWQRLMKSVNELLKKDLRNYKVTFDELQTIFFEIELIIALLPIITPTQLNYY